MASVWKFKSVRFRIFSTVICSKFLHMSYVICYKFKRLVFLYSLFGVLFIAFITAHKMFFSNIIDTFIAIYQTNIIRKYIVIITLLRPNYEVYTRIICKITQLSTSQPNHGMENREWKIQEILSGQERSDVYFVHLLPEEQ